MATGISARASVGKRSAALWSLGYTFDVRSCTQVNLTPEHVIKYCKLTNHLFPQNLRTKINQIENIEILLEEFSNLFICAETLMISPIKALL